MRFFKGGGPNLETLVADYVVWQARFSDLETQRSEVYAKVLQARQEGMDGGDPKPEASRGELENLDLDLEAAAAKLVDLWTAILEATSRDLEVQVEAAPQTEAALAREFEEQSTVAGALLGQALNILEALAIHPDQIANLPEFSKARLIKSLPVAPLLDGFEAARKKLTPKDAAWAGSLRQRRNDLKLMKIMWETGRETLIYQRAGQAVRAAGWTPPPPYPPHPINQNLSPKV